jgi:hypothetical protein
MNCTCQCRRERRGLVENLESRVLLSGLAIAGGYTSRTEYTLNLASDDGGIASSGTIFVDFGDGSGAIAQGTQRAVTHTYNDTQSYVNIG